MNPFLYMAPLASLAPPALLALLGLQDGASPPGRASGAPDTPSHRFAWRDSELHYLDAGEGDEALLLIHGWACDTREWGHQFPGLSRLSRVLALDLPGHGKSGPPPGDYSMALFADAVAAVLADAGVERAVLVGHSNGAPVALNVLRRHPERVLGIVTLDGQLKSLFPPKVMRTLFQPLRGDGWREALRGMVQGMAGPGLAEEDRDALVEMALETSHEAVIGGFEAALDPDAWSEEPIGVPLLAVLAEQPSWSAEYEAWVRDHVPVLDYRTWTGVGHFLHVERPAELEAALEEFLRANDLLQESDG